MDYMDGDQLIPFLLMRHMIFFCVFWWVQVVSQPLLARCSHDFLVCDRVPRAWGPVGVFIFMGRVIFF
jgi:hypothetical protein